MFSGNFFIDVLKAKQETDIKNHFQIKLVELTIQIDKNQ
jgi:hypothetical protein